MLRQRGTNSLGRPFAAATIETVWNKAQASQQHRPLRFDAYGSLIWREGYGNTNSRFGWEIDHIKPVAAGGTDDLENLQPLQWEHNREKGDFFEAEVDAGPAGEGAPDTRRELEKTLLPEVRAQPAVSPPGWKSV